MWLDSSHVYSANVDLRLLRTIRQTGFFCASGSAQKYSTMWPCFYLSALPVTCSTDWENKNKSHHMNKYKRKDTEKEMERNKEAQSIKGIQEVILQELDSL